MKTIQKCVRTYEINVLTSRGGDNIPHVNKNCDNLNSYLSDGWKVVVVTPKSNYNEYIIEKVVEE